LNNLHVNDELVFNQVTYLPYQHYCYKSVIFIFLCHMHLNK